MSKLRAKGGAGQHCYPFHHPVLLVVPVAHSETG